MTTNCEFILIATHPRKHRDSQATEFTDNLQPARFYTFKRRLHLKKPLYFPGGLLTANTQHTSKDLTAHICTIGLSRNMHYVAAGNSNNGYGAAVVDIKSMTVVRPVIRASSTMHNLVVYRDIVVYSLDSGQLFVTGLDTIENDSIKLSPGLSILGSALGSTGLNTGRNMLLDDHMAYVLCQHDGNMSKLVRLSLKDIDAKQPNKTTDSLKIQQVAICDGFASFYVTRKFVYIMEKSKFTRFNKASLTPTAMSHTLFDNGDICQIVGTDKYVYAAKCESTALLKIDNQKLKLVDEIKPDQKSKNIRSLIPGISKTDISFAIRIQENPCGIAIYSALRSRLFVIGDIDVTACINDRILGAMYDADYSRVILCMEVYASQIVELVY